MQKVTTNSQMQAMDHKATSDFGIPGIVLMENAGRNTAGIIITFCREKHIRSAVILCGKGNNGGDGFVVARYLTKASIQCSVYLAATKDSVKGDAQTNLNICLASGITVTEISSVGQIQKAEQEFIIVDAFLGTGVKGAARGFYADLINWIKRQQKPVCSIDIPSGLSGDSAALPGPVVKADFTVTMAMPKAGMLFYPARSMCGQVQCVDIGFPPQIVDAPEISIQNVEKKDIHLQIPAPDLHKHSAGKVFILGGSVGMSGAVILAAKAASAVGSGLVTCGTGASLLNIMESQLTEQLNFPLPEILPGTLFEDSLDAAKEKIDWAHCILIGPGIGRHPQTINLIEKALEYTLKKKKKIVVDADGLFALSEIKGILSLLTRDCVLTPHHGEFLRLASFDKQDLSDKPWEVLNSFLDSTKAVVNLKGAPSIAGQQDDGLFINATGNPGLAKGGSGDVLAGMISGLMASGMEPLRATWTANYIHGYAADRCIEKYSIKSFSQDDLINEIKIVLGEFIYL